MSDLSTFDLDDPAGMLRNHPLLRGWEWGDPAYQQFAACRPVNPDLRPGFEGMLKPRTDEFFADDQGQFPWRASAKMCWELCPVRDACEVYVMLVVEEPGTPAVETRYGVWAGYTAPQRSILLVEHARYAALVSTTEEDSDGTESTEEPEGGGFAAAG